MSQKTYDEIQDELFDMIVEDVRNERVEVEVPPVRYEHVLSFDKDIDIIPNDVLAVFNMLPGCEYEVADSIMHDAECSVFMKAEPSDKDKSQPHILFTLHQPTYMTVYWLAEYLVGRSELSIRLDRLHSLTNRVETVKFLTGWHDSEIEPKLRQHVQRICDCRKYESGMWQRIVKSTVKGRKMMTVHDFAGDAVAHEKPWRGHQHEYDTDEMEQYCHDGKRYQWQYNHNKETDIKNARVLRSDLVVTDSHLHLIAQVDDPRPWYRKWVTIDIPKNGAYTSELLSELRRLFYGRDVQEMMNKLKQHGTL